MLALKAKYWIVCIALCYTFVTTNGCQDTCNKSTIKASAGSSVLLLCSFEDTVLVSSQGWVLWKKGPDSRLINITSKGLINFLDPRHGRLKAFPYTGNYSIRIDALQNSDLGWYCCMQRDGCHGVDVEFEEALGAWNENAKLLFYICSGVVLLILVLSSCYFCYVKVTRHYEGSPPDYENADFDTDTSAPPYVIACDENTRRGDEQERGGSNEQTIYENNEHEPTINQPQDLTRNVSGNESQRGRHGFHRELISRLRQVLDDITMVNSTSSIMNQAEMSQQARSPLGNGQRASFWRKRAKPKGEYVNPIYNNSTDQLNKL